MVDKKLSATKASRDWSDRMIFLTVFTLAAVLRIAYCLHSRQSPFFDHLDLDSRFYDSWARQIASGNWLGNEVFFMGPLYPYFLAVIYRFVSSNLIVVKIVQSLLGSLTVGFTFLLAKELFSRPVGIIASIFAALYVPFIYYDNSVLYPVLAALLNTIMLYFLIVGFVGGRKWHLLLSGLFAGLSAAGNGSILAFAPFAFFFLLAVGNGRFTTRLKSRLLFALGISLVVIPVTLRNAIVGDDFVPLTSNAGLNFYIGNNEKSTGAYVKPEGLDVYVDPEGKAIAERDVGRSLKPSEVSSYWMGKALDFIRHHPGKFVSNWVRKFFLFWSVYEIPQIEHLAFEKRYSWLLRIPTPSYGIICPLGIVGIWLGVRRRRQAWLAFLFILVYSLTIISFFVVARYRLPMIPALMAFAAYTVWWWISQSVEGKARSIIPSVIAFIGLFVLTHVNFYRINPTAAFAQSYYRLGIVYEKKGKIDDALRSYEQALKLDPRISEAHLNLGIALSKKGRYERAKKEISKSLRLNPSYSKAWYNLGLVYCELGLPDSGLVMMEHALRIDPNYVSARVARAACYYEMGALAKAESLLVGLRHERALDGIERKQVDFLLSILPSRKAWIAKRESPRQKLSDRYLLRGDDLLSLGLFPRAEASYRKALEVDPASAAAQYQLAMIESRRGNVESALRRLKAIRKLQPSLEGVNLAIGTILLAKGEYEAARDAFLAELEINPQSAQAHLNLAICYEKYMHNLEMAEQHLSKYVELTGGTEAARKHLKELRRKRNAP